MKFFRHSANPGKLSAHAAYPPNPGRLIPGRYRGKHTHNIIEIDLNQPMKQMLAELSKHSVATQLSLNGTIIVGRDNVRFLSIDNSIRLYPKSPAGLVDSGCMLIDN
jgi:hypothetical protein